jgi:hypothetical protein
VQDICSPRTEKYRGDRSLALKDQIGDQRGGSEWGADKKSCQEFGLWPKSLPKNLAHTCQDHVVTTDLLTLGTS